MPYPICSSRENWAPHAEYQRSLIDFWGVAYAAITVKRVRCSSCGHTHAVLPDFIIPCITCSLLFILQVLAAYFLGSRTVDEMCGRFPSHRPCCTNGKMPFCGSGGNCTIQADRHFPCGSMDSIQTLPATLINSG
ncbi:DUF6431 domain-containing protein [Anaerotruncus colihominis]|uniref:DUF6431 domain-containing protein n=1 Tax=Anaerotruncus colihominis TaxID=169435 RepID=UPI003C6C59E2